MKTYLDMDGVLADFVLHLRLEGLPINPDWGKPKESWSVESHAAEEIKVRAMHGEKFWDIIPPMVGAAKLYYSVREFHTPYILTAKPRDDSPELVGRDKLKWVRYYLDPDFQEDHFICCRRSDKAKYADGNILIDDDPRNIESWVKAGGTGILFKSYDQALSEFYAVMNYA